MNPPAADYNADILQWARQQAALLRAGHFSALDIEHIAEEIEDVGKSEERELEKAAWPRSLPICLNDNTSRTDAAQAGDWPSRSNAE